MCIEITFLLRFGLKLVEQKSFSQKPSWLEFFVCAHSVIDWPILVKKYNTHLGFSEKCGQKNAYVKILLENRENRSCFFRNFIKFDKNIPKIKKSFDPPKSLHCKENFKKFYTATPPPYHLIMAKAGICAAAFGLVFCLGALGLHISSYVLSWYSDEFLSSLAKVVGDDVWNIGYQL